MLGKFALWLRTQAARGLNWAFLPHDGNSLESALLPSCQLLLHQPRVPEKTFLAESPKKEGRGRFQKATLCIKSHTHCATRGYI